MKMTNPHTASPAAEVALRPAEQVMRLKRMGSFHQSRLSFMRVLLRRLKQQNWEFSRPVWRINDQGTGLATYCAKGPEHTYTLVAFAHDLPDELRSDRVIAEAWDATFTLFDGVPSEQDLERLSQHVPKQESARLQESEFVLSRANRSVRLFNHVRDCLANGQQPSLDVIEPVGYLMRTTAVYGSGKFGASDRSLWSQRQEFLGSFQPELLSVWLIRSFTIDLVEHLAKIQAPETAVALQPHIRRRFGVGNSTGLGMAPFLMTHPALLHSWIAARETALSRVLGEASVDRSGLDQFCNLVEKSLENARHWLVEHPYQKEKVSGLRADLEKLQTLLDSDEGRSMMNSPHPWQAILTWANVQTSLEGQEQLISLMLEVYPHLVDDLAASMCADEKLNYRIKTDISLAELQAQIERSYAWALNTDFSDPAAIARVWYVSAEKLEPRLGERFEEDLEPYEQPLAPGRDIKRLYTALVNFEAPARPEGDTTAEDRSSLAEFLLKHPEHRHSVRRLQITANLAFAEIQDNTVAAEMLPIDLLRCKLSFFGATKFDPRSDRWVRITMFQGAPYPSELSACDPDEMAYPDLNGAATS